MIKLSTFLLFHFNIKSITLGIVQIATKMHTQTQNLNCMPSVMFNLLHQNVFVVDDFTICPNRNNEISKIRWNMAISHSILSFSSTAMILCSSVMIFELIATLKVQQIFLKVEEQKIKHGEFLNIHVRCSVTRGL